MATIFHFSVLNLKQLFRDIDYWFWFLMLTTVGLSWAVINTGLLLQTLPRACEC